jgi:hypothetical protein
MTVSESCRRVMLLSWSSFANNAQVGDPTCAAAANWVKPSQEPGNMKIFRFGVNVGPSRSRAEWVEKARKLEDLGYATLTVPDHLSDFFAPMPPTTLLQSSSNAAK